MTSLFKSSQAKKEILAVYDAKLLELNIVFESRYIDTSVGKTHVIVTGSSSNPPLMLFHGSNGCAPIALETYSNLSKEYHVFAVDVLAQPNKSAETRLSMKDNSYGAWVNELLDELNLDKVVLAGFSFGGLIILKTLLHNENRIKEVFLAAPVFIVNGNPLKAIFKVFIPMKRYMKSQKIKYLEKFLSEIFSERDQFAIDYLSKVFLQFEMDFTQLPVISKNEAGQINTPITLIAAKNDILFPGDKMLKRAKKLFPSLKKAVLLQQSKHVQNKVDNNLVEQLILDALQE